MAGFSPSTNSIQALDSLRNVIGSAIPLLEAIVKNQISPEKEEEKKVKALAQGNIKPTTTENLPGIKSPAGIKDVSSSLIGLPQSIKDVAALDGKTIHSFENVLKRLSAVLNDYAVDGSSIVGTKNLTELATALVKLEDVNFFKLLLKFAVADKGEVGKHMQEVLKGMASALEEVKDLKKEDINKLQQLDAAALALTGISKKMAATAAVMPLFNLSVLMMSPAISRLIKMTNKLDNVKGSAESIKNASSLLSTMLKGSAEVLAISIALGIAIDKVGAKTILEGIGITTGVFIALSALTLVIAKISGSLKDTTNSLNNISAFLSKMLLTTAGVITLGAVIEQADTLPLNGIKAVGKIMLGLLGITVLINMIPVKDNKSLDSVSAFLGKLLLLTGGVILLGTISTLASDKITKGLGTVLGVMTALSAIAIVVSALAGLVKTESLHHITSFAGWALGLLVATLAIGAIMSIPAANEMLIQGLGAVAAVVTAYGAIALLTALIGKIMGDTKLLTKELITFAGFSLALVLATTLLGAIVKQGWDLMLIGLAGVLGVVTAFEGILALTNVIGNFAKISIEKGDLVNMLLFTLGILAVTSAVVGIGALIKSVGIGWTLAGLTMFSVILFSTKLITEQVIAITKADRFVKAGKGLLEIGAFMAAITACTTGIVLTAKLVESTNPIAIAGTFVLFGAMLQSAFAIAKYVSNPAKKQVFKIAANDMLLVLGVMASAELLLGGVIALSHAMEGLGGLGVAAVKISITMAAIAGTITGVYYLSKLIEKTHKSAANGAKSLLPILAVAAGAELLLGGVILLSHKLDNVNPESLLISITAVGGLVTGLVGLAILANKVKKTATKGAISLLAVEGVAIGAAAILAATIKVSKYKDDSGVSWGDILLSVTSMAGIVAAFGALAGVAGTFTAEIALGSLALGATELVAFGASKVLKATLDVAKEKEDSGLSWNDIIKTVTAMGGIVTEFGVLAGLAGVASIAIIPGAIAMAAVEKFAKGSIELVKNLKDNPIKEEDKTIILQTVNNITSVLEQYKDFASAASKNVIKIEVGTVAINKITKSLNSTVDLINKFIGLSLSLKKEGTTASELGTSITSLLSVISTDNLLEFFNGAADNIKTIRKGHRAYKNIIDVVKNAVDLYVGFGDKLKNTKVDKNELLEISSAISGALVSFMEDLSGKTFKAADKRTIKRLSQALSSLVSPVSSFAELLSKYKGNGNTLRVVTQDEKGLTHVGEEIDVTATANTLLTAVMQFCSVLYNPENKKKWDDLAAGTSKKGTSNLEKGIGVFASIIDPITKFAEVLSKYEDGGDGILTIPEYDENGKLKANSRKINVANVSKILAGAVTTFIEELYVTRAESWKALISSINDIDPAEDAKAKEAGNESGLTKVIGVFGEILNPILNFAAVLEKFGSDNGMLTVFDANGKPRKVDIGVVSARIADAITSFIGGIAEVFRTNEDNIALLQNNSGNLISIISGFGESVSTIAQLDVKELPANVNIIVSGVTGIKNLFDLMSNVPNENITTFGLMFTTLKDSVIPLTNSGNVPSLEKFNNDLDTLIKQISNASQTTTVSAITGLGDSVKVTTSELKSFDTALMSNGKKRSNELKTFTDAVANLGSTLKSSKDGVNALKDLLKTANSTDADKFKVLIDKARGVDGPSQPEPGNTPEPSKTDKTGKGGLLGNWFGRNDKNNAAAALQLSGLEEVIISAVKKALDEATISLSEADKSGDIVTKQYTVDTGSDFGNANPVYITSTE